LKPDEVLDTLERTDAFRKPERFEQFLLACEADARGRLGLEREPYPQADILRKAHSLCREINAREFVTAGYKDADIGHQLHNKRLQILQIESAKP
jgi:tRNA nucleotidyltransferase (CCA-adding enzyme)